MTFFILFILLLSFEGTETSQTLDTAFIEPLVDIPPRCTLYVNPSYPQDVKTDTGLVILHMLVNEEGVPESTEVFFLTDSVFVEPALEAARFFRFRPAEYRAQKVPCWTFVSIPFIRGELPEITPPHEEKTSTTSVILKFSPKKIDFLSDDLAPVRIDPDFLKRLNLKDLRKGESYLIKVPGKYIYRNIYRKSKDPRGGN